MRRPTKESNIYAREHQSIYVFSLIIVFFFNIPESNIYGTSYKGIINEFNYSEEVALELWEEPDTNIHPNVKVSRLCCFSAHKFQWKWRRRNRISYWVIDHPIISNVGKDGPQLLQCQQAKTLQPQLRHCGFVNRNRFWHLVSKNGFPSDLPMCFYFAGKQTVRTSLCCVLTLYSLILDTHKLMSIEGKIFCYN